MPERPSPRDRHSTSLIGSHAVPDARMNEFIVDDIVASLGHRREKGDVGIESRVEEQGRVFGSGRVVGSVV